MIAKLLAFVPWWGWLIAGSLAVAGVTGWHLTAVRDAKLAGKASVQALWDAEKIERQAKALAVQEENAKITATRILKYQENSDASEIRAQEARVDAVAASSALERMRRRAADAVASGCAASGNTTTAAENGAEAGRVCAELLGRLGEAAGRIGKFADESANDDQTCRADHAALVNHSK